MGAVAQVLSTRLRSRTRRVLSEICMQRARERLQARYITDGCSGPRAEQETKRAGHLEAEVVSSGMAMRHVQRAIARYMQETGAVAQVLSTRLKMQK